MNRRLPSGNANVLKCWRNTWCRMIPFQINAGSSTIFSPGSESPITVLVYHILYEIDPAINNKNAQWKHWAFFAFIDC